MSSHVSGTALRDFMRHVPSPVAVVTTAHEGDIRGMTAGSFTSVCLEPPLVSFNVTRTSAMYRVIKDASFCAIHILDEGQTDLSNWFARPDLTGDEQFAEVDHSIDDHNVPVIKQTLGVLKARLVSSCEAGDTELFVAEIIDIEAGTKGRPLLYYMSSYRGIGGPAKAASDPQDPEPAAVKRSSSDSPDTPTPKKAKS